MPGMESETPQVATRSVELPILYAGRIMPASGNWPQAAADCIETDLSGRRLLAAVIVDRMGVEYVIRGFHGSILSTKWCGRLRLPRYSQLTEASAAKAHTWVCERVVYWLGSCFDVDAEIYLSQLDPDALIDGFEPDSEAHLRIIKEHFTLHVPAVSRLSRMSVLTS